MSVRCGGVIHAAAVIRDVPTLQPVGGWWQRLVRFAVGRPTWEMIPTPGVVEFVFVLRRELSSDEVFSVERVLEEHRAAGFVFRTIWLVSVGGDHVQNPL